MSKSFVQKTNKTHADCIQTLTLTNTHTDTHTVTERSSLVPMDGCHAIVHIVRTVKQINHCSITAEYAITHESRRRVQCVWMFVRVCICVCVCAAVQPMQKFQCNCIDYCAKIHWPPKPIFQWNKICFNFIVYQTGDS